MFVTSVSGTTDLSSWADAGGKSGPDAGDTICQARAAAANLNGSFRAWISDGADDAYCRVRGLSGKKSDTCDGGLLILDRGPWIQTTGFPFAGLLSEVLTPSTPKVIMPPRYDEFGSITDASLLATGTDELGVGIVNGHCDGWTAASTFDFNFYYGSTERTGTDWTKVNPKPCNENSVRLLCFQDQTPAPPLPTFDAFGRLAFLTNETGNGDLSTWVSAGGNSGLAAADAVCEAQATLEGLSNPSSFKPWLSSSTVDAKDRFVVDGPWVRPDGILVAANLDELMSGQLRAPINVTSNGTYRRAYAWTGTLPDGTGSMVNCNDWQSSSIDDDGSIGGAHIADTGWTDLTSVQPCNAARSLLCISDADVGYIFSDGFEAGNVAIWSSQFP